ncbi:MAG: LCP family protein [Clostridium sp.]
MEASASSGKTGKTGRNNPGKTSRKRKKAKWPVILLSLLVVLCVYGGWSFLHRATGYWNIAVFGVDSRDGNTKNALADVQLICSINQETGEIKLVSVYRDTYLKIDSKGTYHKINEAYFKGGHKQAVSALEENLDVKINDYATFNWKAVAQAINVLGGVDIEITQPEFKYINAFITETVNSTGIGSTQLASAGPNHLDGVQAVAYCRLRLMDTDFQRTERQRKVISLALEKAKQADLATRTNLVKAILPQISTSVGVDDVLPMAKNASKYHIGETAGFPFAQKTKKMGKMDCVIPVTLESNVVTLHQFLYGEDALYSPSSTVKKISDHIAEESGFYEGGKAARLLPVPENQTARASHPEQVKIMLRPRLLHKQQLKKVLKQKKQQRRPAIQRIKQQQKRVQQLLLKTGRLQTEKETTSASEGGPGTVKPKETEKAETAADESSKGPGVQKTTENSENDNVSGENTGNTDPIGPGV